MSRQVGSPGGGLGRRGLPTLPPSSTQAFRVHPCSPTDARKWVPLWAGVCGWGAHSYTPLTVVALSPYTTPCSVTRLTGLERIFSYWINLIT